MCANGLEIPVITLLTVFMSMSSQSMEVLFLHLFTTSIIYFSRTGLRYIELVFLLIGVSSWAKVSVIGIFSAKFGQMLTK